MRVNLIALPPGACRYVMLTVVFEGSLYYDMVKISGMWTVMNCAKKKSVVPWKTSFVVAGRRIQENVVARIPWIRCHLGLGA